MRVAGSYPLTPEEWESRNQLDYFSYNGPLDREEWEFILISRLRSVGVRTNAIADILVAMRQAKKEGGSMPPL